MHVLVTGGLGFVGRACIPKLLNANCKVTILDSLEPDMHSYSSCLASFFRDWADKLKIVIGSVTDRALLTSILSEVDVVLHLASQVSVSESMRRRAYYCDQNITGTAVLCDVLTKCSRVQRVVFASSRAVYGEGAYRCPNGCNIAAQGTVMRSHDALERGQWEPRCERCGSQLTSVPTPESLTPNPVSVYGLTKYVQEQLFRMAMPNIAAEVAVLRVQNVYGPGQFHTPNDVGVLNIFCDMVLRGQTIELFEDGQQTRDFVFINDVVDPIITAVTEGLPGGRFTVWNIGSGRRTSLNELLLLIASAADTVLRCNVTGRFRFGDIRHICADITRLSNLGCWSPIELKDGIQQLIEWLRR